MKSRLQTWSKHCRLHVHLHLLRAFLFAWLPVVSKMIFFFFNPKLFDFLQMFPLTKQDMCLKTAWCM